MVLQIILFDFPLVWGVLRVIDLLGRNVRATLIVNIKHVEYFRSEILLCVGIPEIKRACKLLIVEWSDSQSESKLTEALFTSSLRCTM